MSEETPQGQSGGERPEQEQGQNQPTPQEERASKVERVRELIVGPEKRAIENQLAGMKELFSQMLVENKRDYDRQVTDMKDLFVTILDENRRAFRDQLNDLAQSLPKLMEKKAAQNRVEEMVILAEDHEKEERRVEKVQRIEAVKQLVLGFNIEELEDRLKELNNTLEDRHQHQQRALMETANQLEKQLANTSKALSEAIANMMDNLQTKLSKKDDSKAGRKLYAAFMRELGQQYEAD